MLLEEEAAPERIGYPGGETAGDEQTAEDVTPDRRPVHHEIVRGRGEAGRTTEPPPPIPLAADRHVHLRVPFHRPEASLLRLSARLVDETALEEDAEEQRDEDDHQRSADELADDESPAEQQRHDDAELDHEVRRGDLERHRSREVRAFAEERARERDRGVRAARRGCSETACDEERARRVVGQEPAHLALRHDGLHDRRESEAEDEGPEDLPRHPEGK